MSIVDIPTFLLLMLQFDNPFFQFHKTYIKDTSLSICYPHSLQVCLFSVIITTFGMCMWFSNFKWTQQCLASAAVSIHL